MLLRIRYPSYYSKIFVIFLFLFFRASYLKSLLLYVYTFAFGYTPEIKKKLCLVVDCIWFTWIFFIFRLCNDGVVRCLEYDEDHCWWQHQLLNKNCLYYKNRLEGQRKWFYVAQKKYSSIHITMINREYWSFLAKFSDGNRVGNYFPSNLDIKMCMCFIPIKKYTCNQHLIGWNAVYGLRREVTPPPRGGKW